MFSKTYKLAIFISIIPKYVFGFSSIPVNKKRLHNRVDTCERAKMIIWIDAARRSHSIFSVD